MKTVTTRIDENVWREFKTECVRRGTNIHDVLQQLIEEWLNQEAKK